MWIDWDALSIVCLNDTNHLSKPSYITYMILSTDFNRSQWWRLYRLGKTHGEDFLRLPTRSHVGVMELFEDHPSLVMLPHLTGGRNQRE